MKLRLGLCFAIPLVLSTSCTWGYPIDDLREEAERIYNLYRIALQQQQTEIEEARVRVSSVGREVAYAEHERVNPYKDYTPEERKNAELTHILAIAKIMGIDTPLTEEVSTVVTKTSSDGSGISPDTQCRNNGTSNTMNYEDLQEMINTVHIVFGTFSTHKYYIAADYGHLTVEASDHPLFAIFDFMNHYRNLQLPDTLWMNKSPCPVCADRIMMDFSKAIPKPTIYIGSLYTGETLQETVDSFKCLAKMIFSNFTISVWDWRDFHNNIHHEDCRDAINTALDVPAFVDSGEALEQLLQFARQLSHLPESIIGDWCQFSTN